jgi:uncharacterized protein (DUF305 family)
VLALDIMLTQQAQVGQIQGWLAVWGYPLASVDTPMAWMGMPAAASVPGMATPDQINQLRGLAREEAERLFLQLMIAHHRGGVTMAKAAVELTSQPQVRILAQSIVDAQTNEMALMQDLLLRKGLPPVLEMPDGTGHDNAP